MTVTTRGLRRSAAAALTALLLMAGVTTAYADDISNNLDTTVDATYEALPLSAGASGSVTFFTVNRNGDGDNGCNLQGTTEKLVVDVVSSNTAVATVSPSQLTFDNCVSLANSTEVVTVTAVGAGTADVHLSLVSNNSGGTFNLDPARFTVTVSPTTPTNTAPTVAVTGVAGGAAYEFGSVPSAQCEVTDAEDGNSSFPATLSAISGPLAAYGLGEQTASCSYTDAGGLTAVDSVTYTIVDTTDPTITFVSRTPAANAQGWNNTDVTVAWSCSDNVGVQAATVSTTVSTEGADQSATGTCTDVAGNTASDTVAGISIDKTDPGITWNGGPADGATYYYGQVPAAPTCTATDALSGAKDCAVTGYGTAVGTHTMTAKAHDNAGNQTTETRTFTVKAWTLNGFFQPVDMGDDVWNTVKGGSTVPLKFRVFAGSTQLTDTAVVDSFTVKGVACPVSGSVTDDVELTTTGGTTLRYDANGGQFIQNWQTPKKAGACYQVTMTTVDGSAISANFKLK